MFVPVLSTHFESAARKLGYTRIAGIDEAGRGPLAGPVVAAACFFDASISFKGVNDSKKLTEATREKLYHEITNHPGVSWGIGIISPKIIDEVNIYQATILAMLQAVENLPTQPDYLLVDGLKLPHPSIPGTKIIKGDALSEVIACASVLAKVTRDKIMHALHDEDPRWGFDAHKGYGTPGHLSAIHEFGITAHHRLSFAPCKPSL